MEDINDKLALFDFNDKERKNAIEKFLIDLVVVPYEEMKDIVSFLKSKGVSINKARELKIVCNGYSEILKKFSIIESINEIEIYREDPSRINLNALDIFKKIKYCIQVDRSYKKEDGSYEKFLFSEAEWQKTFNKTSETVALSSNDLPESVLSEDDLVTVSPSSSSDDEVKIIDEDITQPFAKIREDLEGLRSELASLSDYENPEYSDEISFSDITPDVYDTETNSYRRAA